jgi:hypothetical protein
MVMARATLKSRRKIRIGYLRILSIAPLPVGLCSRKGSTGVWSWLLNPLSARTDYFIARKSGLRSRSFTPHIKTFHLILKLHRPTSCNTYSRSNQLTYLVASALNSYKYLFIVCLCLCLNDRRLWNQGILLLLL